VKDALGSVIALTDDTGMVKTTYTYDPFGKVTITGEASDNPFQYTGRENDSTGLYYYRARYYSPELQRFISEDPIGRAGGDVNYFAYVGNNPVNLTDPLGLFVPPSLPKPPPGNNLYGNWCGPGGSGETIGGLDKICRRHDECYDDKGASYLNHHFGSFDPNKMQCVSGCDKQLCDDLKNYTPKNERERKWKQAIWWWFNCQDKY